MKSLILILAFVAMSTAHASGTRTLTDDQLKSADLSKTWSMPAATDTLVGRASTDTLTNKAISGASNAITNLSAGSISSGTLGVANGGSGTTTLAAHGVVIGNTTGAVNVTAAGTSGQVLTSNGASADPTYQNVPNSSPSLNGGSASPQSVTAGGGITLTSIGNVNYAWVVGSGGAVTVTKTPSITACTADGQELKLQGTDNTNTVTLQDQTNLASSGLSMNGNVTLDKDNAITFHCDITQGLWIEDNRRK